MEQNASEYISERIQVPEEFEEVFTHFYVAANKSAQAVHKTLLPSFQTILIFSFGSAISLTVKRNNNIEVDRCMVLGPLKQPVDYTLPAGVEILVINFKDDAFYRFFGPVLSSKPLATNPDELLEDNCFTNLWLSLKDLSMEQRVDAILAFSKPYLKNRDASFENFANQKDENTPLNPIKVIAAETGQSERTVQLNHKKYFGYTAKEIGRYRRFLKAMELVKNNVQKVDWFEIIHECGYYDQSQLIHDFKHYLHLSPSRYLKFQQDICSANP